VVILPISEKFNDYSAKVLGDLKAAGIRVRLDERYEKIGKKIRDAEMGKINYMLIIGEKEMDANEVSVRKQAVGDLGSQSIGTFIETIQKEVETE
jgi:threonyl-tRNA synthetase